MDCSNCRQTRREFICAQCLRSDAVAHHARLSHLTSERDGLVAAAAEAIAGPLYVARAKRADVAFLRTRVEEIQKNVGALRRENDAAREQLAQVRALLASRKETLSRAYDLSSHPRSSPPRTPTPTPPGGPPRRSPFRAPPSISTGAYTDQYQAKFKQLTDANTSLQDTLANARQGLVSELVDVFNLAEVGGRPSLGMHAGTRGEWTIVSPGLVFPVPGDIRRYPPIHINAILTHTIHFLGLLTFYLGVKLPFQITWSGGKLGVGQPSICASKHGGTEAGGWAKWTESNPLHLPLSNASISPITSTPPSSPSMPRRSVSSSHVTPYASHTTPTTLRHAIVGPIPPDSASYLETIQQEIDAEQQHPASFTTALAMLLYDVSYLAWTQGVDVPLAQTGEALRNLWAVCCSAELGRRSHETHPPLPPPTPPSFPLDFKQLLQATTADPASRTRARTGSHRSPSSADTSAAVKKVKQSSLIVEEDEWEVVD